MEPIPEVVPGGGTPVIMQVRIRKVTFAADQPQYRPLVAYHSEDGTVFTRWKLSFAERMKVLFGGSIWLTVLTFNHALQPIKLAAECPVEIDCYRLQPQDDLEDEPS